MLKPWCSHSWTYRNEDIKGSGFTKQSIFEQKKNQGVCRLYRDYFRETVFSCFLILEILQLCTSPYLFASSAKCKTCLYLSKVIGDLDVHELLSQNNGRRRWKKDHRSNLCTCKQCGIGIPEYCGDQKHNYLLVRDLIIARSTSSFFSTT